jgi:hypothetical protein
MQICRNSNRDPHLPMVKFRPCTTAFEWVEGYEESAFYATSFHFLDKQYSIFLLKFNLHYALKKLDGWVLEVIVSDPENNFFQMGMHDCSGRTRLEWKLKISTISGSVVKGWEQYITKKQRSELLWPSVDGEPMDIIHCFDMTNLDSEKCIPDTILLIFHRISEAGNLFAYATVRKKFQSAEDHYRQENRRYKKSTKQ